ncbi:MAG: acyl carrier protein [Saprospiraceae bacterium]
MERKEIIEKLKKIIEPYVQDQEAFANINENTDMLNDLKVNSANLVDIIIDAEIEFDIEIDDDSAEKMLTVKDAVQIIEQLTAK